MYEWSKNIIKKIADANILDKNELAMTEVALRMSEIHEGLMNECIGVPDRIDYELEHPAVPVIKKKE
jgi:hypothetical protein